MDDTGEVIDLGGSESSSQTMDPQASAPSGIQNTGGSQGSSPLGDNAAHDINYFFRRANKKDPKSMTVCIVCE
jgi:hypothetical protein